MRQKISTWLVVALLLAAAVLYVRAASAQALPTATAPGSWLGIGGTYSIYQTEYGKQVLGGVGVNIDANFREREGIEAEGRWLRQNQQANTHQTTYLIGPRYQFTRRNSPWKPYVKVLAGRGVFNFPYNDQKGEYFVVAPGAGLQYRLSPVWMLRLIDVEYQRWPQFTYGAITPYGVSFGITYCIANRWETTTRNPRFKRD